MANDEVVETQLELPLEDTQSAAPVQEEHDPADIAAAFFARQAPTFKLLLSKLAPYQLRKAILHAVTYPLNNAEYVPETTEEKQFAYLTHELLLNKAVMQLSFEMQAAEKAANMEQETITETKEENTNGSN